MPTTSDESFFARWSRLKREPDAVAESGDAPINPVNTQPAPPEVDGHDRHGHDTGSHERPGQDCERASRADDPSDLRSGAGFDHDDQPAAARDYSDFDFTKLDFKSDYTEFMRPGVSQEARNKALRQLWESNPALSAFDGLDDCFHDYTDAATVPVGGVVTAYRIGRGFLSDTEVAEWEALGRPQDVEAEEEEAPNEAVADAVVSKEAVGEEDVAAGDVLEAAAAQVDQGAGIAGDAGAVDAGVASSVEVEGACMGAACGVAVKLEEQAALDDFVVAERTPHQPLKPGA